MAFCEPITRAEARAALQTLLEDLEWQAYDAEDRISDAVEAVLPILNREAYESDLCEHEIEQARAVLYAALEADGQRVPS